MFLLFRWADQYSCSTASQSSTWNMIIKQLSMEMTILCAKQLCGTAPIFGHMQNLQGVKTSTPLLKTQYLFTFLKWWLAQSSFNQSQKASINPFADAFSPEYFQKERYFSFSLPAGLRKAGADLFKHHMHLQTRPGSLPPAATILRRGCLVVVFLSSTEFSPRLLWWKDSYKNNEKR